MPHIGKLPIREAETRCVSSSGSLDFFSNTVSTVEIASFHAYGRHNTTVGK